MEEELSVDMGLAASRLKISSFDYPTIPDPRTANRSETAQSNGITTGVRCSESVSCADFRPSRLAWIGKRTDNFTCSSFEMIFRRDAIGIRKISRLFAIQRIEVPAVPGRGLAHHNVTPYESLFPFHPEGNRPAAKIPESGMRGSESCFESMPD